MKKVILLLSVFALVFTSCSSDDDEATTDPFIGAWKYSQYLINGEPQTLEPCEDQELLVAGADGSLSITDYEESETGDGTCVVDETFNATWSGNGTSTYTFSSDEGTDTQEIIFAGNTFSFSFTETFTDESGETITQTYTDVYIRQ